MSYGLSTLLDITSSGLEVVTSPARREVVAELGIQLGFVSVSPLVAVILRNQCHTATLAHIRNKALCWTRSLSTTCNSMCFDMTGSSSQLLTHNYLAASLGQYTFVTICSVGWVRNIQELRANMDLGCPIGTAWDSRGHGLLA